MFKKISQVNLSIDVLQFLLFLISFLITRDAGYGVLHEQKLPNVQFFFPPPSSFSSNINHNFCSQFAIGDIPIELVLKWSWCWEKMLQDAVK